MYEPWERARAISFYAVAPHTDKIKKWDDLFPLYSDRFRKKKKLKPNATIRDMTDEEKKEFEQILNG
jgi:hypothetical protein